MINFVKVISAIGILIFCCGAVASRLYFSQNGVPVVQNIIDIEYVFIGSIFILSSFALMMVPLFGFIIALRAYHKYLDPQFKKDGLIRVSSLLPGSGTVLLIDLTAWGVLTLTFVRGFQSIYQVVTGSDFPISLPYEKYFCGHTLTSYESFVLYSVPLSILISLPIIGLSFYMYLKKTLSLNKPFAYFGMAMPFVMIILFSFPLFSKYALEEIPQSLGGFKPIHAKLSFSEKFFNNAPFLKKYNSFYIVKKTDKDVVLFIKNKQGKKSYIVININEIVAMRYIK